MKVKLKLYRASQWHFDDNECLFTNRAAKFWNKNYNDEYERLYYSLTDNNLKWKIVPGRKYEGSSEDENK